MDSDSCRPVLLARRRSGKVQMCEHGTVHVSLGAVTLRLRAEQLQDLSSLLDEATARLPHADAARPALLHS
ncbi:MAG: hypothetical protein QNK05_25975 [Myxococcota bacterium]|nr:hypothetical protein [Myxococcota bacterium]